MRVGRRGVGQRHQTGLTPPLLALFRPRAPLERLEPLRQRAPRPLEGVGETLAALREAGALGATGAEAGGGAGPDAADDTEGGRAYMGAGPPGRAERRAKRKEALRRSQAAKIRHLAADWAPPRERSEATGDAFRTLFVGRLAYDCSEDALRAKMEAFAPVEKVVIVHDLAGKPRGYAFVEFRDASGMDRAYRRAAGLEISGRRIVVDVERGRTVKGWLPRRLGGGLGGESRAARPSKRELKLQRGRAQARPASGVMRGAPVPGPRGGGFDGPRGGSGYGGLGAEAERERERRRRDDRDRRDRDYRDRDRDYRDRDRDRDYRDRGRRDRDRDYRGRDYHHDRDRSHHDRDRSYHDRDRSHHDRGRDYRDHGYGHGGR